MASGDDIVIPPELVGEAMEALCGHIEGIHGSARWLGKNGHHEASIYFSVLCMEEISKHHAMSAHRGEGVTSRDIELDHAAKVAGFLDAAVPPAGDGPGCQGLPPGQEMASTLCDIKERAVYFGPAGGAASTLGGLLGEGPLEAVSDLLLSVTGQAVASLQGRAGAGRDGTVAGSPPPRKGMRACLAEVMAIVGAPLAGTTPGDGEIPHCRLDAVLHDLEYHLGDLAKATHGLHEAGHEAASVLLAVITLEEGARYYLLAKCRREGRNVGAKELHDMRTHKKKLSEFFKDVARALGEKNKRGEGEGYVVLDPHYYVNLNGVKELAAYFVHIAGETMTLEGILGGSARDLAEYVNESVQGIISWMVVCDGDSNDPYMIHNKNPAHFERYERLARFRTDPENSVPWDGWYAMVVLLKCLNDEVRSLHSKGCKARLRALREFGHVGKGERR